MLFVWWGKENVEGNSVHRDSSSITPTSISMELRVSEIIEAEDWSWEWEDEKEIIFWFFLVIQAEFSPD